MDGRRLLAGAWLAISIAALSGCVPQAGAPAVMFDESQSRGSQLSAPIVAADETETLLNAPVERDEPAPSIATATTAQPMPALIPATIAPPPPAEFPAAESVETPAQVLPSIPEHSGQEIGASAEGRPIHAHRLGSGETAVVLVGGIHGGYEWNSILLAQQLLEHFRLHPESVPAALSLHIIPIANPDGLFAVTGREGSFKPADMSADTLPGRFNGNDVDLNRNWDCNWSSIALWRAQTVSGGSAPFSEPETVGLREYLLSINPVVVVFLHSAANAVYVSGCPEPHPPSYELAGVYGQAAGYPVHETFDHYAVTGDAGDWLTTQGIASFSVELSSHESLDWQQNLGGMTALLDYVGVPPDSGAPEASD